MAKAKKTKSPVKAGDLSPSQIARIRELGRAGAGWRPWRLAKRYGVSEAKIVELIGVRNSEGRTGGKWVAKPKAAKPKKVATVATKKAARTSGGKKLRTGEKKSQHPAEKVKEQEASQPSQPATPKEGGVLANVFKNSAKPAASEVEIDVNAAQAA